MNIVSSPDNIEVLPVDYFRKPRDLVANPRLSESQVESLYRLETLDSITSGSPNEPAIDLIDLTDQPRYSSEDALQGPALIGIASDEQGIQFSFWERLGHATIHGQHSDRIDAKGGSHGMLGAIKGAETAGLLRVVADTDEPCLVKVSGQYDDFLLQWNGNKPHYSDLLDLGPLFRSVRTPGSNFVSEAIARNSVFGKLGTVLAGPVSDHPEKALFAEVPGLLSYELGSFSIRNIVLKRELTTAEFNDGKPLFSKLDALGNSSERLSKLESINGISIAELEERMRPSSLSIAGFLGANESLVDRLVEDNDTVANAGLTHEMVAEPLQKLCVLVDQGLIGEGVSPVTMAGKTYLIDVTRWMGSQTSPFGDEGHGASYDVCAQRLTDGKTLSFSALIPKMIAAYGFYEGDTSYRVSPTSIIDFFGLKK
ncbi:MAG: hypothetical protein QG553_215 [Patescibacteria group bacterium]|nr:hypothetical protein [Patescibacteria group bacterium]